MAQCFGSHRDKRIPDPFIPLHLPDSWIPGPTHSLHEGCIALSKSEDRFWTSKTA